MTWFHDPREAVEGDLILCGYGKTTLTRQPRAQFGEDREVGMEPYPIQPRGRGAGATPTHA